MSRSFRALNIGALVLASAGTAAAPVTVPPPGSVPPPDNRKLAHDILRDGVP